MDGRQFWKIIDASRQQADGDDHAQIEALREQLRTLPVEEIVSFHEHFRECEAAANRNDLYAAATIIDGFWVFWVSDDSFEYFRYWLIAQGRQVFEDALRDPENLADVIKEGMVCLFEAFGYVSALVWEEKTGQTMDKIPVQRGTIRPEDRANLAWKDDEDLKRRFPKLWAKFAEQHK